MIRDLQLRKGGRLFVVEWDNDQNDFIDQEIDYEELIFFFYDTLCLGKGVTLKDIFLLIERDVSMFSVLTCCPFLESFVAESLLPPKKNKDISSLYLCWNVFIENSLEDDNIVEYIDFYGMGAKEQPLTFSPINEIIIYPIIIDETYNIKKGGEIILSTIKKLTMADVLFGIVSELSCMGDPEIRDFAYSELLKTNEENIMKLSQEEIENRLKERIKENIIPCKHCSKDSRSAVFEKPKNVCYECFQKTKEN